MIDLKFKLLHPAAKLPTKCREHDAGWDLYAPTEVVEDFGDVVPLDLGIAWDCPPGWYAQIVGRSGLAKKGVDILGGTIDAGYRGPWTVLLECCADSVTFAVGDRIAQFVLLPVPQASITQVEELGPSDRGTSGFGGSGR